MIKPYQRLTIQVEWYPNRAFNATNHLGGSASPRYSESVSLTLRIESRGRIRVSGRREPFSKFSTNLHLHMSVLTIVPTHYSRIMLFKQAFSATNHVGGSTSPVDNPSNLAGKQ